MNQYKKLFEPITIRNMTLDNRLVMAPMEQTLVNKMVR